MNQNKDNGIKMQKATATTVLRFHQDIHRNIFSKIENNQTTCPVPGSAIKKIATWNVRSLFETVETHNSIKEIQGLKMDNLGIWVTRVQDEDIYY